MKFIKNFCNLTIMLLFVSLMAPGEGFGQNRGRASRIDNREFVIQSKHSRLNLNSTGNKSQGNVNQTKGITAQHIFKFEKVGNGLTFKVKNVSSGLYLTLLPDNNDVVLRKRNNTNAQVWKIKATGRMEFEIKSIAKNVQLDIKNNSKAEQANILAATPKANKASQSFKLIHLPNGDVACGSGTSNGITIYNEHRAVTVSAYLAVVNLSKGDKQIGVIVRGGDKVFSPAQIEVGDFIAFYEVGSQNDQVDLSSTNPVQIIQVTDANMQFIIRDTNSELQPGPSDKTLSTTGNLYGYDLRGIDPIDLSTGEGRKKRIINQDRDLFYDGPTEDAYVYDDIFLYSPENKGSTEVSTSVYHNSRDFKKSFTFGANASVGSPTSSSITVLTAGQSEDPSPSIGVSASGGFHSLTENSRDKQMIYIYNSATVWVYSLSLHDNKVIPLSIEFINAVKQLPAGYNLDRYKNFINDWGTHFPKKVVYGGRLYGAYSMEYDQVMNFESRGWNVGMQAQGQTASVAVSGGFELGGYKEERTNEFNQNSKKHQDWYGGEMASETDWGTNESNAMPVNLELLILSDLLQCKHFRNLITPFELETRRKHLKRAINQVIKEAAESEENAQKSRFFNMEFVDFEVTKNNKRVKQKIYGKITGVDDKYTDIFNQPLDKPIEMNEHTYIDLTQANLQPTWNPRLFQMKVPDGASLNGKEMKIIPDLLEVDRRNVNSFSRKTYSIPLSTFPKGAPKIESITYNYDRSLDITIRYRIWEMDFNKTSLAEFIVLNTD